MDFVQVESLILLLEELAFPHVGEEQLLAEVLAVCMLSEHTLEQGCHFCILSERHIAVDKVKDSRGITLLLADLSNYVLTLVVLAHFQETVGLNCVEKWLLRVLLEAFNYNIINSIQDGRRIYCNLRTEQYFEALDQSSRSMTSWS